MHLFGWLSERGVYPERGVPSEKESSNPGGNYHDDDDDELFLWYD